MRKQLPKILSISLIFVLLLTLFPIQPMEVSAESSSSGTLTLSPLAEDDERFYYQLEAEMPEEEESSAFNVFGRMADALESIFGEATTVANNIIFYVNMSLAIGSMVILDGSANIDFINMMVDKIATKVKEITGISGTTFGKNGMFYPIIRFIVLFVILYAFYQLVWKRSFIQSFSELLKFVAVLTLSLLLFANYGTFLKGMNTVSAEIGQFIVGSKVNASFQESVWNHLVDEPYLYLQYGTSSLKEIGNGDVNAGKERVRELLTAKPFSDERIEIIDKEVNERENYYMTYKAGNERLGLNIIYVVANFFTFLSFIALGLSLMFTQFWFVIMAIFAPIALLIASFPSQFGVLKRYSFELILPLLVKIGLHLVMVMIMLLTTIMNDFYQEIQSSVFDGKFLRAYLTNAFYSMLFIGLFLLRKRITGMLSSGSQVVNQIREGMAGVTTKPAQSAIQTTSTVAGATIGFAVGGTAGAGMGANIGSLAGKTLSGQSGGVAETAENIGRIAYQHHMLKETGGYNTMAEEQEQETPNINTDNTSGTSNSSNENEETHNTTETSDDTQQNTHELYQNFNNFADELDIPDEERQIILNELNEQEVEIPDLSDETLENALINGYDKEGNPIKMNPTKNPELFAERVKQQQMTNAERIEALRAKRIEKFNDFLKQQKLTNKEINSIHGYLESKNIDVAKLPRSVYVEADKIVKEQIDEGKDIEYADVMKKVIENKALNSQPITSSWTTTGSEDAEQMTKLEHQTNYENHKAEEEDPDIKE